MISKFVCANFASIILWKWGFYKTEWVINFLWRSINFLWRSHPIYNKQSQMMELCVVNLRPNWQLLCVFFGQSCRGNRINLNSNGLGIRVKRFMAVSYCFITFLRITVWELCKVVVILTFTVRQPSSVFTLRESSELMKKQTRQSIDSAKEILLDKKQSKEERDG